VIASCESFGRDPHSGMDLLLLAASDPGEAVRVVAGLSKRPFLCLLVWDAEQESVDAIDRVTEALLAAGCVYLCAWGTDCERVHDICDENIVAMELDGRGDEILSESVMTTWHEREAVDEALWFLLRCAVPDDDVAASCTTSLVLAIGVPDARVHSIRSALADPVAFARRVERERDAS
jgi:hypothetical protein